jgi:hypothetical protein
LPFVPNSMVISNDGSSIYMGSTFEIMTFSATSNTLTSQDTSVTGAVLAVSPDGSTLVITDPIRQFVYLYTAGSGGIQTQFGGVGTHAVFSPDSQTVYITEGTVDASCAAGDVTISTTCVKPNPQLLVHSLFTGWYQTNSAQATTDVAIAVPTVGAFFGCNPTSARSYCPVTTTTTANGESSTTNIFYPDAGVIAPASSRITATNDGLHVLGATTTAFTDLAIPNGLPIGNCPLPDATPQNFATTPVFTGALPGVTATAITGVLPTSDSKTAFVTYTGTGGVVPAYTPQATGAGALTTIPLSTAVGTPIAPIVGVISADNQTFYAGTSGDNAVHLITKQTDGSYKDITKPIIPALPDANGNIVAPNLLVQKPRKATS